MLKRKNRFSFLLIMVVLSSLLFLTACGGGSSTSAPAPAETPKPAEQSQAESGSGGGDYEPMTLKLGHQAPETTNYQDLALKFKELVEEKTNGKVQIEIYPYRQLGTDRELMEQMQFGNVDLGAITSAPVSAFAPEYMVLDLPFIFKDWDHIYKFLDSPEYLDLLKETEKSGLMSLGLMARGFRHITNNAAPIEKPEDVIGKKLRVIESPIYVSSYQSLGSNPQAMNWPDTYMALQQGAIDGQENTMDIIHDEKVDEVQKYVSKTGINAAFINLMASKPNFDKWPKEVQEVILEAGLEATHLISQESITREAEYEKILIDKGMEINDVDREPFRSKVIDVYHSFTQEHGDKYFNAIERLRD